MRRSLWSSIEALRRDELDVAFGRVRDLDHPWPNDLRRRLVQLEPTTALVGAGPDSRLIARRVATPHAACALAISAEESAKDKE